MSLKIKLVSAISAFVLVLSMLLVGVYAASQTINLRGEVNFNIEDTTLYVKDIRMQSETIENFMPGYINSTLDLNLGTIESTSGVVMIEIDMINTTATDYTATSDSVLQNASLELSGTVTGSSTPIEEVATTQTISGTITLTITYTGTSSVTLDDIALSFTEYSDPNIEVTLKTTGNNTFYLAYIIGEGNTDIIDTGVHEMTISIPYNTKICVIGWHAPYGYENDHPPTELDIVDWSIENELFDYYGPSEINMAHIRLIIDGEEIDRIGYMTNRLFYAVVNIVKTCTIEMNYVPTW